MTLELELTEPAQAAACSDGGPTGQQVKEVASEYEHITEFVRQKRAELNRTLRSHPVFGYQPLQLLEPELAEDALVIADHSLGDPHHVRYRGHVNDPRHDYLTIEIPIDASVLVSKRQSRK